MKKLITNNLGVKLLSLLLAIVLWILINGVSDPVKTVTIKDIPVSILNEEAVETEDKLFEIKSGKTVSVKVRGKATIVSALEADDFVATADFRNMSMTKAVPIDIACSLYGENDIEILDRAPLNMLIELEDLATQSFRVSVAEKGVIADGYYIVESSASPNIISVSGTKTAVGSIDKIEVGVDVTDVGESFKIAAKPIAYDKNGKVVDSANLDWGVEEIIVSVNMLPVKEVEIKASCTGSPNWLYTCTEIQYDPEVIKIAGEKSDLEKLESIELTIDVEGAKDDVESTIRIDEVIEELYGNKYIIAEENADLKVAMRAVIEQKESKEIEVPVSKIDIRGLDEGMTVSFAKETIDVTIYSNGANLKLVNLEDLRAYIDLSNCKGTGTYNVFLGINNSMKLLLKPTLVEISISELPAATDNEVYGEQTAMED